MTRQKEPAMTDMPRLSTPDRLVQRMARANGLDLTEETRRGRITADDVSEVIQSCSRCAAKAGCKSWLAVHETPVATTPGFCRNKPRFDGLRTG